MKATKIYTLEQEYSNCDACELRKNRRATPHFGIGHPNGDILLILPYPYMELYPTKVADDALYDTSPMQMRSKEKELFSKILNAVSIDKTRIYAISSVMCPKNKDGKLEREYVEACSDRLKKVITEFSPRVLVLSGPQSYYSFFDKSPDDEIYGKIYDSEGKTIFYVPAFHYYIESKDNNMPADQLTKLANTLFSVWKEIGATQ